jgi:hypothetical protein
MTDTLASSDSQSTWLCFFTALCVIEAFMLINFRLLPNFWGDMINIWYDRFGLVAIMLDMLIVLIGFWITQKLYNYFFGVSVKLSLSLWKFIVLFLCVQIIHDILFYVLILKNSKGSNAILDLINSYGNKHGIYTILGDSLMVFLAISLAYVLLNNETTFSTYIIYILLSLYFIGYLLYTKWHK